MSARAQTLRTPPRARRATHLALAGNRSPKTSRRAGSRKRITGIAVVLVAAGAIIFSVLLEQVILAQSAFELNQLRKDLTAAESRHEELLLEAARLDSAVRIERFARRSLGMVAPAPGAIEYVVAEVGSTGGSAEVTASARGGLARSALSGIDSVSASGDFGDAP